MHVFGAWGRPFKVFANYTNIKPKGVARLRDVGVEAKLIPKPGIGHGTFPNQERDIDVIAEWSETHLLKRGGRG